MSQPLLFIIFVRRICSPYGEEWPKPPLSSLRGGLRSFLCSVLPLSSTLVLMRPLSCVTGSGEARGAVWHPRSFAQWFLFFFYRGISLLRKVYALSLFLTVFPYMPCENFFMIFGFRTLVKQGTVYTFCRV